MTESDGAKAQRNATRLRKRLDEYWEPLSAAIAGLVLAVAGIAGWLEGNELAAATLLVLSALGGSLVRERSLRARADENIKALGVQLDDTIKAVNAIQSGNPYSVLSHESTWDIASPDGSLVHATRIKRIRFDQNKVVSLYDFASGDGKRENKYTPGEAVADFIGEGRWCSLIALGRVYYRGEHLNFKVERTVRDGFMSPHESVGIVTQDATDRMRMTILWPADQPPTALRLGRATPTQEWRSEDVLASLKSKKGRPTYTVEIHGPEKGSTTIIEWEWEPSVSTGPAAYGLSQSAPPTTAQPSPGSAGTPPA
jgi:hypothetical protein